MILISDDLSNLDQVLLLTSDDLAVTTDAHVLIVNQVTFDIIVI